MRNWKNRLPRCVICEEILGKNTEKGYTWYCKKCNRNFFSSEIGSNDHSKSRIEKLMEA